MKVAYVTNGHFLLEMVGSHRMVCFSITHTILNLETRGSKFIHTNSTIFSLVSVL